MTFIDLRQIEPREQMPGYHGRFVHSATMTFVYWEADAGAAFPSHAHPHEQVVNMLEGQFEITIGGETRVLGPESVAIVPPNVLHSGRALTSCRILDVFNPIREDYRK